MQNISFTPHFELREFVASKTARDHGINNTPPEEAVENLKALCQHTLEPLREALGLPIIITSGYRCKALNHLLVNHSVKSQHMNGQAADFYVGREPVQGCPSGESAHARDNSSKLGSPLALSQTSKVQEVQGLSRRELLIKAFREILLNPKIDFDQLILYPTFIHVSFVSKEKNRRGIMKARSNGKLGYGRLTLANALRIE